MKTSLYTILCTAIRLGAVWLGLNVLLGFTGAYQAAQGASFGPHGTLIVVVWSAMTLGVAFLLWVYPGLLARPAAAKSSGQVFDSPIAAEQLQQLALAVLGMWFVVTGLISLLYQILQSALVAQMELGSASVSSLQVAPLTASALQIILGGALTMGSRGLASLILRAREAGRPAPETPSIQNTEEP
jgi:hypothetical protein